MGWVLVIIGIAFVAFAFEANDKLGAGLLLVVVLGLLLSAQQRGLLKGA